MNALIDVLCDSSDIKYIIRTANPNDLYIIANTENKNNGEKIVYRLDTGKIFESAYEDPDIEQE